MTNAEDDNIDMWKQDTFEKGAMKHSLLQETSFATLFAKYREKYIRDSWPKIAGIMKSHGIKCELDLMEGSMLVKTTKATWDPFSILKARDMLRLLSRGVDAEQAAKIFKDEMFCDIIKIGGFVQNKERFVKRRQRLVGPNGTTLKAIELLTNCYVLVHGTTVCAMGPAEGLENVRKIVEDCMKNIHPVYNIKEMMIKREIKKNDELAGEDWGRFLPKFKKAASVKRKVTKQKKEYTPFPPAQPLSEIDKQLESGEYFLGADERDQKRREEKLKAGAAKSATRVLERAKVFVPPVEPIKKPSSGPPPTVSTTDTIKSIQQNISKNVGKRKETADTQDFFVHKKKNKTN